MELNLQAPVEIVVGANFEAQLIVVCSLTKTSRLIGDGELCFLWAFVSLSSLNHNGPTIAQDKTLQGNATSSFRTTTGEETITPTVMLASFPQLKIIEVGQYRLRVDVVDMGS